MSAGPEQRLNPEERANLVAWIDGELTENESRAIATKLTASGTARREVDLLKQTWELLEYLPRPRASHEFEDRTVTTMRSLGSRGSAWLQAAEGWAGGFVKLAAPLLVAAGSLAAGYVAARQFWPDPILRMAENLSFAEHLEEYQEVGSFELLEELARSSEFGYTNP